MSSPPIVMLDSSSSSANQSDDSSSTNSIFQNQSKLSNKRKNKTNDKYLISADQWTPIAGPSVPKPIKQPSNQPHQHTPSLLDPITHSKLVNLFEPSSSFSTTREDVLSTQSDHQLQQPILVPIEQKVSIYISSFEQMLNTVLRHESFLFLPSELRILNSWQALPRTSKYLFIRLFIRKHDNWFRLDKLSGYQADIGDLNQACAPLCNPVDQLVTAIPTDPFLSTPNPPRAEDMSDIQYLGNQPPIYPGQSPNITSAQLPYNPPRETNDDLHQFTGHQLNPYEPYQPISHSQYAPQEHSVTLSSLFAPSPPAKINQLNTYNPYQGMDQIQYPAQEHATHLDGLDGYMRPSPRARSDPLDSPQHSTYHDMADIRYSVEQPVISLADFLRSSPGTDLDQPAPYSPYAEMNYIQSTHQVPCASIDELLRCNAHDMAMLDGSYAGLIQDTEHTYQGQFVSPSQISPSTPLLPQLGHDPVTLHDSPTDSIKTDEGIIAHINRVSNQTDHKKEGPEPLNKLSLHGLEQIPFDAYDFQTLPDLPPIPPPVDIRPLPHSQPPDPISTIPSDLTARPSPGQTKRARVPQSKRASPVQKARALPVDSGTDPELSSFAIMTSSADYAHLNTDELFGCMNLDELKSFAKKLKANPHTTRDMIIVGIKSLASNQSTLFGAPSTTTKGKQKKQLSLKFTKKGLKESQISALNSRIMQIIGPSIKLRPKVCSLFRRLHLIFYRSTTISEKTMTASMLAHMGIRNYPNYSVIRTSSIFESREHLIKYEEALELEKQLDDLLVNERRPWNEDQQGKARRQEAKTIRLKKALDVFESAWMLWQIAVCEENDRLEKLGLGQDLAYLESNYYKKRFHPGWPLTRILQKGLVVLARFEEHEREVKVLEALIQQPYFRRGKRGQWYDRLALVLMTHLARDESLPLNQRQDHITAALYTCEHGLTDPDTHQLYRFSLGRRLARLHALDPSIHHPSSSSLEVEDWKTARRTTIHRTIVNEEREIGAKTRWLSCLDCSPISVEEIALEHYLSHDRGWRGFHSETGILKMIFSLVFWDVIFAAVPGAFETSFQTAPLDMATDAFRIVRRPLIEDRVRMIEDGGVEEIVGRMRETYVRESERKTWSIGIGQSSWDRYSLEDLQQIVRCFSVQAFTLISNAFFEDWSVWAAGAPDLCLWNPGLNRCKFVEVKGPGDKLSEQQKHWFSLLLKAEGIEVEICSVKED